MKKTNSNPQEYTFELITQVRMLGAGLVGDAINELPFCFSGDGMTVFGRNLGFLNDKKFTQSYTRALERFEIPKFREILKTIIWRKHILCSLANQALNIPGDFVECGVEWGFGVDVVSNYIDFQNSNKKWYLYDTYSGVPTEDLDSGFKVSSEITKSDQYSKVSEKFKHITNISVIRGRLPEVIAVDSPSKIAYLHIDLNNASAEISTFIKLYERVSIGGTVIFDDYGALLFAKQHSAEISLLNSIGISISELPTGQGFFIKTKEIAIDSNPAKTTHEDYNFDNYCENKKSIREIQNPEQALNTEDIDNALSYHKSQLNYISEFISTCEDPVQKKQLVEILNTHSCLNILKSADSTITYSTFLQFKLTNTTEARVDLQNKIDHLQNKIDQLQTSI